MATVVKDSIQVQIQVIEGRDGGGANLLVNERVALRKPPIKSAYPHFLLSSEGGSADAFGQQRRPVVRPHQQTNS